MGLWGSKKRVEAATETGPGKHEYSRDHGGTMQVEKKGGFWIYFRQEMMRVANSLNYVGERKGKSRCGSCFWLK